MSLETEAGTLSGEMPLPGPTLSKDLARGGTLRPVPSVRAGCPRAERQALGPPCSHGRTDRRPGGGARRASARAAAGLGGKAGALWWRGGGGRTRGDGMGCDERRAVHCGNPGAAATGSSSLGSGAGRRGERGASGGKRGGGPASGQRGESRPAAERARAGHLAVGAAAEPPRKSRAGSGARSPPAGPRRRAPRPRARGAAGLVRTGRRSAGSGLRAWRGAHRGLARSRRPPRPCSGRARASLWFCSKSKPGSQLL